MSGRHPGWQWMVEQGAEELIGYGHEEENRRDKEKAAAAILSRSSLTAVVKSSDMLLIRASRTSTVSHSSSNTYRICDNTPSLPHPVGGKASQAVSPGSPVGKYTPRKETPKSTHARRRPGEDAPSDKHELCDRTFTCPRRRPQGNTHASPSHPVRSPQTLQKPPSDTPSGPSENPPVRACGASLSGGRPKLRTPP